MRGTDPATAPVELEEDTLLAALFATIIAPPPSPCKHAKTHNSSRTSEIDDFQARKMEQTNMEATRRASLVDEETHHCWYLARTFPVCPAKRNLC